MPSHPELHRRAVEMLRTDRLFGVDFVPRRVAETLLELVERGPETGEPSPGEHDPGDPSALARLARELASPELARGAASAVATAGDRPPGRSASAVPLPPSAESAHGDDPDLPKAERLASLRARHDRECPHCTVATAHTQTVFGDGDPDADLMFIGEAPGETEDRVGRPFVGRAGQKLDEIIAAMGLSREAVYIANVLKSRPPDNRTPLRSEVDACGPYLRAQIRIIRPKVIVTLGGPATKLVLGVETGITRLRGVWAEYGDGDLVVPVMPTFHPAYLLRNYTPQTRRQVWSDMQEVCRRLRGEP